MSKVVIESNNSQKEFGRVKYWSLTVGSWSHNLITAVVKKVVGTHYFLAIFGPIGAHFGPQPLRQPHGMTVSHIVNVNHTVVEKKLEYGSTLK